MPVTEQDAIRAMGAFKMLSDKPELQAKAKAIHDTYRAEQESAGKPLFPNAERARAQVLEKTKQLFQNRETHGLPEEDLAALNENFREFPDEKYAMFNRRFFEASGIPREEVKAMGDGLLKAYSLKTWGEEVTDPKAFHARIGEDYDTEDELSQKAQELALKGSLSSEAIAAFDFDYAEDPRMKGREEARKKTFTTAFQNVKSQLSGLEPTARVFVAQLKNAMGSGDGGGVLPDEWFLNTMMEIPKDKRGLFLATVAARAGEGEAKTIFQAMAERMGRGATDIVRNTTAAAKLAGLDQEARNVLANTGEGGPSNISENLGFDATTNQLLKIPATDSEEFKALSPKQQEELTRIERERDFTLLYRQVNDIATGAIDPAKGSNWYASGLIGVAGMVPNIALMASGPVGVAVNVRGYQGRATMDYLRDNPDVDARTASMIGATTGVAQGLLDFIPTKIVSGKLPFLSTWLKKATLTKGGLVGRSATRLVGGALLETGQEFGQDVLAPGLVEELAGALKADMPEVNWDARLSGFTSSESLSELIPSIVMLSLIGAGVGGVNDYKGGWEMAGNLRLLKGAGINDADASLIYAAAKKRDAAQTQRHLREALAKTDNANKGINEVLPEAQKVALTELVEETKLREEAISKGEVIGILPVVSPLADGRHMVRFKDGTEATFANYQEASDARWEHNLNDSLLFHEDLVSAITQLDKGQQVGQGARYSLDTEKETALERKQKTGGSEAAFDNRADTAETVDKQNVQSDEEIKAGISREYDDSWTASEIKALSTDDRLAALTIIGENSTEFENGLYITNVKLHGGATWATVVEEKLEGDATNHIRKGRKEWLKKSLRDYERITGEPIFRDTITDDDEITDADIKEAYARAGLAYFVGTSDEKDGFQRSAKFKKRYEAWFQAGMAGSMEGYDRFFMGVAIRADALQQMRKKGALDPELERELARSTGFGEQAQFEREVEAEAGGMLEELVGAGFVPTEDAPFSVIATNQDTEYLNLAKDPEANREKLQAMVDEAARAAGYDSPKVFHGTDSKDKFTVFDKARQGKNWRPELGDGFYFGKDPQFAKGFGRERVISAYLKIENPLVWQRSNGQEYFDFTEEFDRINPAKFAEKIQRLGHDGLIAKDGQTVVFEPSQIKSADSVTYDESGNVIPLSQRFNPTRDEITYSVIANASSRIADSFNPFFRDPEQKRRILLESQKRVAEKERELQPIIRANRTNADIEKERKTREGELIGEKLDLLSPSEIGALEAMGTLDDVGMRPILSDLLREKFYKTKSGKSVKYWRGSLMSKSAAQREGIDTKGGEWDGIPEGLPPYVWGGSIMPDQAAAQFGFESTEEFWTAISAEVLSFQNLKADTKAAMARIRELEKEAKAESKAWAKEQRDLRRTVGNDRATLIGHMRTLEAMISALPAEIRGRVGGFVRLAQFTGPDAMSRFLEGRVKKLHEVLEDWLKKEADKQVKKLLEKAVPAKDEAGKKRVGKAGADIHDLFDTLRQVYRNRWTAEKAEEHAAGLEAAIAKGELSAEEEAHKLMEVELVRLLGGWKDSDAMARNHAFDTISEVWTEGYHAYKLKKAQESERRAGIRDDLRKDTGKAGKKSERALAEMAGVKLPGRSRDFFLSLLNFEQLTQWAFGKDSTWAQWFADEQRKAENAKLDAVQSVNEGIEDLFTELAGGNHFNGEKLQFRMMQRSLTAKAASGDIVPLTELEALSALLMWQQEDGKRHLRGRRDENGAITSEWAYDDDFIEEISGKLSTEAWKVLEYLQSQYSKEHGPLNAVYREIYGVNLPQNPNYSPLLVKPQQAQAGQTVDPVTGSTVSGGGFTPGSLRSRGNATAEPDFRDAVATFIAHKKQIEHWKAHARFVLDANAVLGNREVGNSVEAAHGAEAVKILRKWLDAIAQGGVRNAAADTAKMKFFEKITGRAASMALIGRIGTLAIQSTQLGAAAALMPTGAYVVRLGKLLSGNLGWGTALASPYIQRRLSQQPIMVQAAMEGLKAGKPTQLKHQVRKLGSLLNGADALFTAGTYAITYDYHFTEAIRGGMTATEAASYATETAERVVESVAQPTRLGTRSFFEVSTAGPFARLAWAFASDSRKNAALVGFNAAKGSTAEASRAVLFVVLLSGLVSSVIRNAWRDMRDDEDDEIFDDKYWSPKRMALSTSTDWLGGFPVIGEEVQRSIMSASGEYSPDGGLLSSLSQSPGAAMNLIEGDSTDTMRDIEKILTAIGLFSDTSAALTSVAHIVRDIYGLGENLLNE